MRRLALVLLLLLAGPALADPAADEALWVKSTEALKAGDAAAARQGFDALAQRGMVKAQCALGRLYIAGTGVKPDPRLGLDYCGGGLVHHRRRARSERGGKGPGQGAAGSGPGRRAAAEAPRRAAGAGLPAAVAGLLIEQRAGDRGVELAPIRRDALAQQREGARR